MLKVLFSYLVFAGFAPAASSGKGLRTLKQEVPVTRIVGGTSASWSDFPFFVDLNGCGGSLIWEDSKFF